MLGAAYLIAKINDTRSALANLKLGKTIPVGNAEAGFYFNTNVLKAIDFGVCCTLFFRFDCSDLIISSLMCMLGLQARLSPMLLHGSSNISMTPMSFRRPSCLTM
jgi:hypothetical protein